MFIYYLKIYYNSTEHATIGNAHFIIIAYFNDIR